MTGCRWIFWSFIWGVVFSFVGLEVDAAEYAVTPSLKLRETYDDNVFFKDVDDFEHRLSPGLQLDILRDTSDLSATCTIDISEYADYSELNTVDQAYGLSAKASLNPLLKIGFSGSYVNDYTFRSALEESGLVAERSKRKSLNLGPTASVGVDPRNTLIFDYGFEKTQYSFEDYADYWLQGLTVTWGHDLVEEQTSVFFGGGGHMIDFDRRQGHLRQYNYRAFVGFKHRFTETLNMTFYGGARRTKSESEEADGTFRERDWGFLLDGGVEWKDEKATVSSYIRRDLAPSIYDEVITRDRVGTVFGYRFTERFRCGIRGEFYRSETEGIDKKRKGRTFWIRPSLQYRLTEHIALLSGYRFTSAENLITNRTKDRNQVFIELTAEWPKHF